MLYASDVSLSLSYCLRAGHSKAAISGAIGANLVVRMGALASGTEIVTLGSRPAAAHSMPIPNKHIVALPATPSAKVAELRVYPIKSCASGSSQDTLVIDNLGPQHDRCLMVCQRPHWNRNSASNAFEWQDSWGAVTPRTPKENSATKQKIDGSSLLLVHVTVHPDATMTISSRNASRPMPDLRVAAQPPPDAPLIENVSSRTPRLPLHALR